MYFTEKEILVIRTLWSKISVSANIGSETYNRLFYLDPAIRDMFTTDMGTQVQLFTDSISLFIDNIEDLSNLSSQFGAIGETHIRNRVSLNHYEKLHDALIYVFKTHLVDLDDVSLKSWTKFYWRIVDIVKQ